MKARRTRQYRRVAQACENCRRKKVRCPGQKPTCSTCSRLNQPCVYVDPLRLGEQTDGPVIDRLSQLESTLNRLVQRVEQPSGPNAAPVLAATTHLSESTPTPKATSLAQVPTSCIAKALGIYFESIHRQPLWLFEAEAAPTLDSCEELVHVILALGLTFDPLVFADTGIMSAEYYAGKARRAIMLSVADESVTLQTLQALCLLAFFNVVFGNLSLASFNISLAKSAVHYSMLGPGLNGLPLGSESKLFWSIALLDSYYAAPTMLPYIREEIDSPCFATIEARFSSMACPPLPRDSNADREGGIPDIWSHSMRIYTLWGDIRLYISRCIQGLAEVPWQSTSDYAKIYSKLMDHENAHPLTLRYNDLKFHDKTPAEMQSARSDWLPWFRLEVTYHTIHCVLNHPFLYSVRPRREKLGANSFWRESSEKALRHCTWIARLIRKAGEKGLRLTDPFFAQGAAVAAILHLYWTRSRDAELRASAVENLGVCRGFITDMASHWPVCASLEQSLHQLITLSTSSDRPSTTSTTKTSLMWSILDMASTQFPSCHQPVREAGSSPGESSSPEDHVARYPPREMRESTAHYASPPEWLAEASEPTVAEGPEGPEGPETGTQMGDMDSEMATRVGELDFCWGPWEHMVQAGDYSGAGLDWLDFGNL